MALLVQQCAALVGFLSEHCIEDGPDHAVAAQGAQGSAVVEAEDVLGPLVYREILANALLVEVAVAGGEGEWERFGEPSVRSLWGRACCDFWPCELDFLQVVF